MRKEFKMTDEQRDRLLEASKPTPAMWDGQGHYLFGTPEENAMAEWKRLGSELGFDPYSVRPVLGKTNHYFTAEVP